MATAAAAGGGGGFAGARARAASGQQEQQQQLCRLMDTQETGQKKRVSEERSSSNMYETG
jgi:hypothetical protein